MKFIRNQKNICSRVGLASFFMMLAWLVVMTGAQMAVMAVDAKLLENVLVMWLLNDLPLYLVAVPIYILLLHGIPNGPKTPRPKVKFGVGGYLRALVFGLGATYVFNMLVSYFIMLLRYLAIGQFDLGTNALNELVMAGNPLMTFFFGVCIPAFGEEFVFRYLLRRKMNGSADITYILMSGLCFAVFHMNIGQMFYAFVLGALFAWIYLMTDNIWLPISLHFIVNLLGTLVMPELTETPVGSVVASVLVLGFIGGAIVIFVLRRKHFFAAMRPPTEPGWYYKPPKRGPAPAYAPAGPAPAPILPVVPGEMAAVPPQPVATQPMAAQAQPAAMPQPPAWSQPLAQTPPPYDPAPPYAEPSSYAPQSAGAYNPYPGGQGYPYAAQPAHPPAAHPGYPAHPGQPTQPAPAMYPPQQYQSHGQPHNAYAPGTPAYRPYGAAGAPPQPQWAPPPYGYYPPAAPYPLYPPPKTPSNLGACLSNVGMVLYLVLGGVLAVITLATMVFMM